MKRICKNTGCEKVVYGAFLCKIHYLRAFSLNRKKIWLMKDV